MLRSTLVAGLAGLCLLVAGSGAFATGLVCTDTPFGKDGRMVQDAEFMDLIGSTGSVNEIEEYRPYMTGETPPITQVYNSALLQGALAGGQFAGAVNADLNGDGRDEIVVAARMPNNTLMVGAFERGDGFSPGAVLLNTWAFTGDTLANDDLQLVAGGFDGTGSATQQVAILWMSSGAAHSGHAHLVVLSGASDGSIAQADNAPAGEWISANTVQQPKLVHGDFVLDGRDQLAVISEPVVAEVISLNYDLLEYGSAGGSPNPIAFPTLAGNSKIGSISFQSAVITILSGQHVFGTDDTGPFATGNYAAGGGGYGIQRLDAAAGDVVDSAAAELVLHVGLHNSAATFAKEAFAIGQKLVHFVPVRSGTGPNNIVSISLGAGAPRVAGGPDYDSERLVISDTEDCINFCQNPRAFTIQFSSTIGDVDGAAPSEIVLAVLDGDSSTKLPIVLRDYSATIAVEAGFTYTTHSSDFGADFTNTSIHGQSYSWNFGDSGSGANNTSSGANPSHVFTNSGTYTVSLHTTDSDGIGANSSVSVTITNNTANQGGTNPQPSYAYRLLPQSHFVSTTGTYFYPATTLFRPVVGDMNRDGRPEVMLLAVERNTSGYTPFAQRFIAHLDANPDLVAGPQDINSGYQNITNFAVLASDFDGDSIRATLGTCGPASDNQLRALIWTPPYFQTLQTQALTNVINITATFGKSLSSSTSNENQHGSYTSHSVSGFVGVGTEFSLGPVEVEASVSATFGRQSQVTLGASHTDESSYTYTEGTSQSSGEALVQEESTNSNCYLYDFVQSDGAKLPDSGMRLCQILTTNKPRTGATNWNALSDQTITPYQAPPQWVPLERDWASLALFRPVTSNASFPSGGAANATDGRFSTPATSLPTTAPYLEIDLGAVRDIEAIRVFPAADMDGVNLFSPLDFKDAVKDLAGFVVYASVGKFNGPSVPSGAGVTSFAPDTADLSIRDRWNIWTGDPVDNTKLLRARYIRLQHPGSALAKLNISEIQVFGATHSEPPKFPDAVCDPTFGDGLFLASVWNSVSSPKTFQTIEVRGDMMWSGANLVNGPTVTTGVPGCSNDSNNVRDNVAILDQQIVSGQPSSGLSWNLDSGTSTSDGVSKSFDSSTSIGASFDAKGGVGVIVQAGGAVDFTKGITKEFSTSSTWGTGLSVGGEVGGFDQDTYTTSCGYAPRPYAFHLTEYSNTGFRHDAYVTDYIVREAAGNWTRANLPSLCQDDEIFYDNGEIYH